VPVAPSRADIEDAQWRRLSQLLRYTYDRSPFHRRRLDAAGAQPDRLTSLAEFRRAVPLTRKEDVVADQEAHPPYGERLCVTPEELVQINITGGTSGRGQEIYGLTSSDTALLSSLYGRGLTSAGLRRGDVVALTFPMSMAGAPLWIYQACQQLQLNVLALGPYDTQTKLRLMRQFGARAIIATPSYLQAMSATAESELGWDVARELSVDLVLTATEAFSLDRARAIEQAWGARLFEWYGATPRVVAWNCEHGAVIDGTRRGLLHHFPYLVLHETLHPETHEPVDYGEEGEVVFTFLASEASPLLRYATGDRARLLPGDSCACGGPFDGYESGTIGRYDDMIKVRGVNLWPRVADEVVLSHPAVANYVGVARSLAGGRDEVVVDVEFRPGVDSDARAQATDALAARLQATIGLRFDVRAAQRPLPKFTDTLSKAKRWSDERVR
jgi:phenylacetate-CoA ligase